MRGQRTTDEGISPFRMGLHVVRAGAAVVLVFVVARAAYYPIWAAGASREQLDASWGGPNPFGATLAHWLVAALIGAVCLGLVAVSTRLLRRRT
ncbi:hypothetical protein [Actinomarinicola tropica]|uniref:DUF1206 domain-containing protein n=1 Tax=Actinomarinicola tropica TaxID=2789776 RepID=A0A5Q2RPX9_9ACTN|nr:hypothetical protein [Actinomarinicola tropica]QGG96496.1 hypothetical protein GH723_16065 [Actinomarinicola tropica]